MRACRRVSRDASGSGVGWAVVHTGLGLGERYGNPSDRPGTPPLTPSLAGGPLADSSEIGKSPEIERADARIRTADPFITRDDELSLDVGPARAKPHHSKKPVAPRWRPKTPRGGGVDPASPGHLHGKEGVDGSSPSEGFRKGPQMAFFVASARHDQLLERPKTCPQDLSPRWSPNLVLA